MSHDSQPLLHIMKKSKNDKDRLCFDKIMVIRSVYIDKLTDVQTDKLIVVYTDTLTDAHTDKLKAVYKDKLTDAQTYKLIDAHTDKLIADRQTN